MAFILPDSFRLNLPFIKDLNHTQNVLKCKILQLSVSTNGFISMSRVMTNTHFQVYNRSIIDNPQSRGLFKYTKLNSGISWGLLYLSRNIYIYYTTAKMIENFSTL